MAQFCPIPNQIVKALVIDPQPQPRFNRTSLPVANALNHGKPTGFRIFIQRCTKQLAMGELVEVQVVRVDRDGHWAFADYLPPQP